MDQIRIVQKDIPAFWTKTFAKTVSPMKQGELTSGALVIGMFHNAWLEGNIGPLEDASLMEMEAGSSTALAIT
jgi:hypothetical protein